MKWYTSISSKSPTEYFDMLDVAVYSCIKNTSYKVNILSDESTDRVEKWKSKGVNVIYFNGDVFSAFVEQFKQDNRLMGIAATYLRSNIPVVEKEDAYVLYTDADVMFLNDKKFKINLPKYIACAPEFNPNDWSYFNAGSMIINIENMKNDYKKFADFVIPNFEKLFKMAHDQGAYNFLYKGLWERLPIEMNWKPYWGVNPDAKIIHFHGPKPNDIKNYFDGTMNNIKIDVMDNGTELYKRMINMNIEGNKYYKDAFYSLKKESESL